jgi:hypothetical protein
MFYAPIRVYDLTPSSGPSKGGTTISITGTGFVQSDKLRIRFTYGNLSYEIPGNFDEQTNTIMCKTPKFDDPNNDN